MSEKFQISKKGLIMAILLFAGHLFIPDSRVLIVYLTGFLAGFLTFGTRLKTEVKK